MIFYLLYCQCRCNLPLPPFRRRMTSPRQPWLSLWPSQLLEVSQWMTWICMQTCFVSYSLLKSCSNPQCHTLWVWHLHRVQPASGFQCGKCGRQTDPSISHHHLKQMLLHSGQFLGIYNCPQQVIITKSWIRRSGHWSCWVLIRLLSRIQTIPFIRILIDKESLEENTHVIWNAVQIASIFSKPL